ncbi:MAG: PAS domain S-box protein [Gammaproteobacteria bacterium]|nr:PAS domain S-box protein [Gammaproteobacteria bacterium]
MIAPPFDRRLFEHLTTAILLVRQDMLVADLNPAAEELLGLSVNIVRGGPVAQCFPDNLRIVKQMQRVVEEEIALAERELHLIGAMGEVVIVDCILTLLDTGASGRYVLVELVRQERLRQITREEHLLVQNASSRAVLRGLAHEIRNPLSGLRGAAQLLERELSDPDLREYTQVIVHEADRLQNLLDRMLGPRKPPERRLINLHEVTERVWSLVKAEIGPGVELIKDYDPSIPEIFADPEMLIQAVLNVARNAVQAVGEHGQIVMRTRIHRQASIGHRHHKLVARLEVVDNGPGIPAALAEHIFYPLITGRQEGTGLGLSIAQSLVQQHGGLIECKSTPGCTVFSVLLPVGEGEQ